MSPSTGRAPAARRAPEEPVLAVEEIQGNVIPGFNTRHQVLLGFRFGPAQVDGARRWLASLVGSIATLGEVDAFREVWRSALRRGLERPPGPVWVNVAFDVAGLSLLAPVGGTVADRRFREGMGPSSGLGDPRDPAHEGHPSRWVVGGSPERTPQVLLVVGGDDLTRLRRRASGLRRSAAAAGLTLSYDEEGHGLEGEIEHFGFRDGISQAGPRGRVSQAPDSHLTRRYIEPADERTLRFGRPGQPLVWPGQFVFGYPRQRDDDPVRPGPVTTGGPAWMANGSFLVFRRLRQDVAAFRAFVAAEAARLPGDVTPERLAALLVGRWPKGTALMRSAAGDEPDPMADRFAVNHFGFGGETRPVVVRDDVASARGLRTVPGTPGDRFGRICPGFAHIRKVNPRDLSTDKGGPDRTLALAVLRRGIPWGRPYPEGAAAQRRDKGRRGLLFLSYQTSIKDQFEVLNSDWMNRESGPEGETGHDLLVGQGGGAGARRERSARLPSPDAGGAPTSIVTLSEWVIPTGGGYFFAPSVSALRLFASAVGKSA